MIICHTRLFHDYWMIPLYHMLIIYIEHCYYRDITTFQLSFIMSNNLVNLYYVVLVLLLCFFLTMFSWNLNDHAMWCPRDSKVGEYSSNNCYIDYGTFNYSIHGVYKASKMTSTWAPPCRYGNNHQSTISSGTFSTAILVIYQHLP